MQNILNVLNNFQGIIIIALSILVIILLCIIVVVLNSINRLESKYKRLMRGVNNKNLEDLIIGYLDKIDVAKEDTDNMKEMLKQMDFKLKKCIQNVSIVRYRAFEDVGSDLSFSVALLDNNNSGVLLTGIYGRNESTTYAKPIDNGISRYDLSEEEQQALKDAIIKKNIE